MYLFLTLSIGPETPTAAVITVVYGVLFYGVGRQIYTEPGSALVGGGFFCGVAWTVAVVSYAVVHGMGLPILLNKGLTTRALQAKLEQTTFLLGWLIVAASLATASWLLYVSWGFPGLLAPLFTAAYLMLLIVTQLASYIFLKVSLAGILSALCL